MEIVRTIVQFWWLWLITAIISGAYFAYTQIIRVNAIIDKDKPEIKKVFSFKSLAHTIITGVILWASLILLGIAVFVGILRAA